MRQGGGFPCNHYLTLVSHRSYRILPDMFKLFPLGTPDPPIPPWPGLLTHMGTTQPQPLPPDIFKLVYAGLTFSMRAIGLRRKYLLDFFHMRTLFFYQNVYATFNLFHSETRPIPFVDFGSCTLII